MAEDDVVYHITSREDWGAALAAGWYAPPSLAAQGFVHCSTRDQVVETANRFFHGRAGLVLLCIEAARLGESLRYEPPDMPGHTAAARQALFPHVYAPVRPEQVVRVLPLPAQQDGTFMLPAELGTPASNLMVADSGLVTVRATNYEGRDHWVHPAALVSADAQLVVTQTWAGLDIRRGNGKTFTSPYNTHGHYWPDRWFNVIRLELPGQGLYGYYCNIATPLLFDGATVGYVDLQLDVIARVSTGGGLTYWLADEDEFEVARDRFGYDDTLIARCYAAVQEVSQLIDRRAFPFDG